MLGFPTAPDRPGTRDHVRRTSCLPPSETTSASGFEFLSKLNGWPMRSCNRSFAHVLANIDARLGADVDRLCYRNQRARRMLRTEPFLTLHHFRHATKVAIGKEWPQQFINAVRHTELGSHDDDFEPPGPERYSPGRLGGSPVADRMAAIHTTGTAGSPRGNMADAFPLLGCACPSIARLPGPSATGYLLSRRFADEKRRLHRQRHCRSKV